jgi:hypothetical protein
MRQDAGCECRSSEILKDTGPPHGLAFFSKHRIVAILAVRAVEADVDFNGSFLFAPEFLMHSFSANGELCLECLSPPSGQAYSGRHRNSHRCTQGV